MAIAASIREHGDHVYITCPVGPYEPEPSEIEAFAFASDLRSAAPNPKILWLRGQYVEADQPNRNGDQWTAGELAIKALTPVLMPITVMHDLRSAVGTIADARLLTPTEHQVPRARIDTTLAVWAHRFPEVAEECRINARQGTLMASMECIAPTYDCSVCGVMMQRGPNWEREWHAHVAEHTVASANVERSPSRILRAVLFTGVGLIFGTRGARGAMPTAQLEVEELAAIHREAHEGTTTKRPRRRNTVEIEDSKYEGMVAGKAEADGKVNDLTAKLQEAERKIETLEAAKLKAEEERNAFKLAAEQAEEKARVGAMRDERLAVLGTGFRAKLDKLETTAKRVKDQAATLSDEDWTARLEELEETLGVKRDAQLDAAATGNGGGQGGTADPLAGLLDRTAVQTSAVGAEITAGEHTGDAPTPERRQSVMGGLVRRPKRETAKA
jgi:hypothetical protein